MQKVFRFEIRRGFRSRFLWISFLLSGCIIFLDFVSFYVQSVSWSEENVVTPMIEAWIGTDYKFAYNSLFFILLPMVASLPFGASYFEDIQSGYIKNICLKCKRTDYLAAKCISVFFTGFIAVLVPLLLDAVICMSVYPLTRPEKLLFLTTPILDIDFMSGIYNTMPLLYVILYAMIDAMYGGIFAVVSVCISEHVESRFSSIAAPFAVYILLGVMLSREDYTWSLLEMLNPIQYTNVKEERIFGIAVVFVVIIITWILKKGRRKDIF